MPVPGCRMTNAHSARGPCADAGGSTSAPRTVARPGAPPRPYCARRGGVGDPVRDDLSRRRVEGHAQQRRPVELARSSTGSPCLAPSRTAVGAPTRSRAVAAGLPGVRVSCGLLPVLGCCMISTLPCTGRRRSLAGSGLPPNQHAVRARVLVRKHGQHVRPTCRRALPSTRAPDDDRAKGGATHIPGRRAPDAVISMLNGRSPTTTSTVAQPPDVELVRRAWNRRVSRASAVRGTTAGRVGAAISPRRR